MLNLKFLLKDPESSYMDDAQLAAFRAALLERQQDLKSRIEARKSAISVAEAPSDQADQGSLEEARALNLRFLTLEQNELQGISTALGRIADGTYGFCDDTGEPIGLARLIHNPTAIYSVESQTLIEKSALHRASAGAY